MKAGKPQKQDRDMQNATAALVRAAKRARQLAAQTRTELVVIRDGKLVREVPPQEKPLEGTDTDNGE